MGIDQPGQQVREDKSMTSAPVAAVPTSLIVSPSTSNVTFFRTESDFPSNSDPHFKRTRLGGTCASGFQRTNATPAWTKKQQSNND
jgi:hypothetical protein